MATVKTYTFDWNIKEHAHVTTLLMHEKFSTGIWRIVKWIVVGIIILGTVLAVSLFLLGDTASAIELAPWLIAAGVLVIPFYKITGWIRAWQIQRSDPNIAHPFIQTLDEEGFHISMHTINVDLIWTGMHKVRETPDLFLFYYSKHTAYYLPKRLLAGKPEIEGLREWIRNRLPPAAPYTE